MAERTDTLWFTRCPAPTAATVAIRNGWLEEEFAGDGIAVRSLASVEDRASQLAHYSHTKTGLFRFGGYVPPLVSLSRGTDIRIVGLGLVDRRAGLYALPDSGPSNAADLAGRRLAVPRRVNDSVDWWRAQVLEGYDAALAAAGLRLRDVRLTEVAIARTYAEDATTGSARDQSLWGARSQFAVQREEAMALVRGEVDVLYTDAAMGALLTSFLGLSCIVELDGRADAGPGGYPYLLLLTVDGAILDSRPDLVERWLVRLLAAEAWSSSHEAEAKRMIARDTGLPEELVAAAYSERVHRQLDVSLDDMRIAILERKLESLARHGFLVSPVEIERVVDRRPLRQARARCAADGTSGLE